ncbi:hypothetical protein Pelo_19607 [Pelomyxa schiedti]|nr:hypothetical protein Pelo_19607 [Pelomyxa schiedti]
MSLWYSVEFTRLRPLLSTCGVKYLTTTFSITLPWKLTVMPRMLKDLSPFTEIELLSGVYIAGADLYNFQVHLPNAGQLFCFGHHR